MFNSLLPVFDAFLKHSVHYLVVGGTAVSYYGRHRPSITASGQIAWKHDLDIWYQPTYTNYYALLKALAELGKDTGRFQEETAPDPKNSFFCYEFEDYTLDVIPRLCAKLNFGAAYKERIIVRMGENEIPFIALDDLLKDKQALGRPKDLIDIENLRTNAGTTQQTSQPGIG